MASRSDADIATPPRRPLIDPELLALDPGFDDPSVRGRAVDRAQLTAAALRARFAQPRPWRPEIVSDRRLDSPAAPARAAAVLVPLVARDSGLQVLLTRRTDHLHDHAGQISFPGGGVETSDRDPVAAALRESHEEVGLDPARVEVLGSLPVYSTATGYDVTPVVGLVELPSALRLDTFEVAEAFEVPLAFLMDPAHHQRRIVAAGESRRFVFTMPYVGARRYLIWGATAAMLRNLYRFLSDR